MYINLGKVRLYIGKAFALFFAFAANTAAGKAFVLSFIAALLHELTHLFFLFECDCKKALLEFFPGGIKLNAEGFSQLSYKDTVLCTVSAPLMNIFTGILSYYFGLLFSSQLLVEFSTVNLILGIINLLPLRFLDGGRALYAMLLNKNDMDRAEKICDFFAFSALIFIAIVFFLTIYSGKYYIFIMFFFVYCVIGCFCDKTDGSLT